MRTFGSEAAGTECIAGRTPACSDNVVLTSWSILVGEVAAMQTLKALEPVAAAGFSRWLLGSPLPPGRATATAAVVTGLVVLMVPLHSPWRAGGSDGDSNGRERGGLGGLMASGPDVWRLPCHSNIVCFLSHCGAERFVEEAGHAVATAEISGSQHCWSRGLFACAADAVAAVAGSEAKDRCCARAA